MIYRSIYDITDKYEVIYSDPPWQQQKGNLRKCRPNQSKALCYDTMSLEAIVKLHNHILQNHTAEKHNVFMWTIDKFLPQAENFMQELGYQLHARMVWDKENGIAPAFTVRFSHEYLLWFYKKGKMLKPSEDTRGKYTTIIREKSTEHSRKPIRAYSMLENMFPSAKKLELFARNTRKGWDSFGNEI